MDVPSVLLRPARSDDAERIASLLEPYAAQKIVLPRSPAEIRRLIVNFIVAEADAQVVGAVALRDFGEGLEEIRSLVVHPGWVGRGLGSELVSAAIDLGRGRHAVRIFALTLRPRLFQRSGFRLVEMSLFPQKVWHDCTKCPKEQNCDEVAVVLDLV